MDWLADVKTSSCLFSALRVPFDAKEVQSTACSSFEESPAAQLGSDSSFSGICLGTALLCFLCLVHSKKGPVSSESPARVAKSVLGQVHH